MDLRILDIKSNDELLKHQKNDYEAELLNRDAMDLNNSNLLKVDIKKFSSFCGSYYFSGKDPLVNTALEYLKDENIYNIKNILDKKNLTTPKSRENIYKKFLSRGQARWHVV